MFSVSPSMSHRHFCHMSEIEFPLTTLESPSLNYRHTPMLLGTSRSLGDRGFKDSWRTCAAEAALHASIEAANTGAALETDPTATVDAVELLSHTPTVAARKIDASDHFVILACDGVWDVLSNQQACDCVSKALEQPHGNADSAARALVSEAFRAGSDDNISVIIVQLRQELV